MDRQEDLVETFFNWLRMEAFPIPRDREVYEGVLRQLHEIPFYWTMWSDENRAGDALEFRRSDFLACDYQGDLNKLDQHWLGNWAMATPSVLEVLLGMARRWSFFYEKPPAFFFSHMFTNLGMHHYPGKRLTSNAQDGIRAICDQWMSRQFAPDGQGSPFPVYQALPLIDMRQTDIWGQMNAYSAEHFQQ